MSALDTYYHEQILGSQRCSFRHLQRSRSERGQLNSYNVSKSFGVFEIDEYSKKKV